MRYDRYHKGSDIKQVLYLNINLDDVINFYVIVVDPLSNRVKQMSMRPEVGFIDTDMTQLGPNSIEVRIHRAETEDWGYGNYHFLLFASFTDNGFENAIRVDSNSKPIFRLIHDNVPTDNQEIDVLINLPFGGVPEAPFDGVLYGRQDGNWEPVPISVIDLIYLVGSFTPTIADEYPDITGVDKGASWVVIGVDDTNGYTFTAGDLAGKTVRNGGFMTLTNDSPEEWVILKGASTPGEVLYTNPTPMPEQVGGYEPGTTFTDIQYDSMWDGLLYPYQTPIFSSFSIAGQQTIIEVGETINGSSRAFNWATTNNSNIQPNTISIADVSGGTTLLQDSINDGIETLSFTDVTLTSPGSQKFRVSAINTNNATFSRDYDINYLWRTFWGSDVDGVITGADILNGSNRLDNNGNGVYSTPAGAQSYRFISYPASFGKATQITDTATGLEVAMDPAWNPATVNITNQQGVPVDMYVYRTSNQTAGELNMEVIGASITANPRLDIPGSVPLTGFIAPIDSTDSYAVTDEMYHRGGYRTVQNTTDRDNITEDRRKAGMLVFVYDDSSRYRLEPDLTTWVIDDSGTGGGIPEAPTDGDTYARQSSAWVSIQAVVDNSHTHSNLSTLNIITDTGTGNNYLADDGTYKPVSGGSNPLYTNTTPMPEALGGYPVGTTFDDAGYSNMWDGLLYPYQYPTFNSFNITGQTSIIEVGTTVNGTNKEFVWGTTNNSNINPNSISIIDVSDGNTSLISDTANDGSEVLTFNNVHLTIPGSHTFRIEGENSNNDIFSRDYSIRYLWRNFWGNDTDGDITEADILAGSSRLDTDGNGIYNTPAGTSSYRFIAYPVEHGNASQIIDSATGLEVAMDPTWSPRVVNITNSQGVSVDMNVYRTANMTSGELNMEVKGAAVGVTPRAKIPGSVPLTGFIAPIDELDTYAVTDEYYNKGGYRTVADIAARDAITVDRRKVGMLVYVQSDDKRYRLNDDLTSWTEDTSGSGGIPEAPEDSTFYGRKDAAWVNPEIADINELQDELDNRRVGKDKLVEGIDFVVGHYLRVCTVSNIAYAGVAGVVDSSFYAPSFKLDLFHVYNGIKYEFGLTHYTSATASQFDQLVFTQTANGSPIDIYLRIANVDTVIETNIGLSANYTVTDPTNEGIVLHGGLVTSITDEILTVDITSKDFRSTNVAPSTGATDFLSLSDTPTNYSGSEGYSLKVNEDGNSVEFVPDYTVGSIETMYRFDTNTTGNPATGRVRVNNANYTLVTEVYINETDLTSNAVAGALLALDKDDVFIIKDINTNKFVSFTVNAKGTDESTWWTIPVTYRNNIGGFFANEFCNVGMIYLGAKTFTGLHDTPTDYLGQSGKLLSVNTAEDGLEFIDAPTGGSTFDSLTDTPTDKVGNAGNVPVVNATEDELIYEPATMVNTTDSTTTNIKTAIVNALPPTTDPNTIYFLI